MRELTLFAPVAILLSSSLATLGAFFMYYAVLILECPLGTTSCSIFYKPSLILLGVALLVSFVMLTSYLVRKEPRAKDGSPSRSLALPQKRDSIQRSRVSGGENIR